MPPPPPPPRHSDEFELLSRPRSRSSSHDSWELDDPFLPQASTSPRASGYARFLSLTGLLRSIFGSKARRRGTKAYSYRSRSCGPKRLLRKFRFILVCFSSLITILAVFTAIFNPSYTKLPPHYLSLAQQAASTGRANPNNEKVFIAANIINADLIDGAWGNAILGLIDILGAENVFLSVFENDSGLKTTEALRRFEAKVKCNSSVVSEHLPIEEVPTVTLPSGQKRVKRIAYLAEVRNRALRPLDHKRSRSFNEHPLVGSKFDKVLFVNDVVFAPLDAAQLLFSTNVDQKGRTQYRAACAVDFINPFKFYDTFATRDLEGFGMGVPFFPWFSKAGQGYTRQDVLAGSDAVRVRSCWGGMVSFEARWLQGDFDDQWMRSTPSRSISLDGHDRFDSEMKRETPTANLPIRFRAESDTFWDASECCLIHADIQKPRREQQIAEDVGIFLNPFVRVAYSARTHSWLRFTRRFERLYSFPHAIVNKLAGLPFHNPRRLETEGQEVEDKVWVYDDPSRQDQDNERSAMTNGSFQAVKRVSGRGGFCGSRMLLVLRNSPTSQGKKWEKLPIPPGS